MFSGVRLSIELFVLFAQKVKRFVPSSFFFTGWGRGHKVLTLYAFHLLSNQHGIWLAGSQVQYLSKTSKSSMMC